MESLVPEFVDWSKDEDEGSNLTVALDQMSTAVSQTAKAIDKLHRTQKKEVYPIITEMNSFNKSVSDALQRRSSLQFA